MNHTPQGSVFTLISSHLLPLPDEKTDTEQEGTPHWLRSLHFSSHFHILSHSTVLLLEPERQGFTPKMAVTKMSHWEVIRLPFCLLDQAWIWTRVLTSLMSDAPLPSLVPAVHWAPLCIRGPRPDSRGRLIPLRIKLSFGAWWALLLAVWGDAPLWQGKW
jgi:hypothetical protein